MQHQKDISIIIPVFNSENSLKELNMRLNKTLMDMKVSYEIIYVDDCSNDSSWKVLKEIVSSDLNVVIVKLAKNFGQHNATLCGMKESNGQIIITMDDDLEHRPEDIPELYSEFINSNLDVLYAVSKVRRKSVLRNLLSYLWYRGSKFIEKEIGRASSYRVLNNKIVQSLTQHKEPFMFIESVLYWYTENIQYKEVTFEKRKHGKSNYSIMQLFTLNHDIGMHYNTHILRFMKSFGVTVLFGAIVLIGFNIYRKIFGNPVPGYTSIIITLLFSTGSVLWGMGYLGIYIGKMFKILNKEPQYHVAKKISHKKTD